MIGTAGIGFSYQRGACARSPVRRRRDSVFHRQHRLRGRVRPTDEV